MIELLTAIAMMCSVAPSFGDTNLYQATRDVHKSQAICQKYYLDCVDTEFKNQQHLYDEFKRCQAIRYKELTK